MFACSNVSFTLFDDGTFNQLNRPQEQNSCKKVLGDLK